MTQPTHLPAMCLRMTKMQEQKEEEAQKEDPRRER